MIDGLIYFPSFITEEEEKSLLEIIDQQAWLEDLRRRTQQYGYKYDYTKKKIDESMAIGSIPKWLSGINERLLPFFTKLPDQIIINEYLPGQGIGKHVDCVPCFGSVVSSLSLVSTIPMEFEFKGEKQSFWLEPRSLLILEKDARFKWAHSIAARTMDEGIERQRRISLTFRTVLI